MMYRRKYTQRYVVGVSLKTILILYFISTGTLGLPFSKLNIVVVKVAVTLQCMSQRIPTYKMKLLTRWHTLNTMGIRSKLVQGILIYVGIRWHTSEAVDFFVHAYNSQRMPTYELYAADTLEVRWIR